MMRCMEMSSFPFYQNKINVWKKNELKCFFLWHFFNGNFFLTSYNFTNIYILGECIQFFKIAFIDSKIIIGTKWYEGIVCYESKLLFFFNDNNTNICGVLYCHRTINFIFLFFHFKLMGRPIVNCYSLISLSICVHTVLLKCESRQKIIIILTKLYLYFY